MPREKNDYVQYSQWVPCIAKGREGQVLLSDDLSIIEDALKDMGVHYEIRERKAWMNGKRVTQRSVRANQEKLIRQGIDIAKWMRGEDNGD